MKKIFLWAGLAAIVIGISGCKATNVEDVYYEIIVAYEGENSMMMGSKDTDAKNAYDLIKGKLSAFEKEVHEEWVENGEADKDAQAKFDKASERLKALSKESEKIIADIPYDSGGSFKISRVLVLRRLSGSSSDGRLAEEAFSVGYSGNKGNFPGTPM